MSTVRPGQSGQTGEPGQRGERDDPGEPDPAVDSPDLRRRRGVARALALLEKLRFSNAQIREVGALVDAAAFPPAPDSSPSQRRRWLADVGRDPFPGLFRVWLAGARVDAQRRHQDPAPVLDRIRRLRADLRGGTPLSVDDLALDGRDLISLGFRPGRHFGTLLRHLLDRTLEDPSRNRREWLEEEAVRWMDRRDR